MWAKNIFLSTVKMQRLFIFTYSVIVFRFNEKPSNIPIVKIVSFDSPNRNWRWSQKCIFYRNLQDWKWIILLIQKSVREMYFILKLQAPINLFGTEIKLRGWLIKSLLLFDFNDWKRNYMYNGILSLSELFLLWKSCKICFFSFFFRF